jgi:A/G-specific adenine glycosylase
MAETTLPLAGPDRRSRRLAGLRIMPTDDRSAKRFRRLVVHWYRRNARDLPWRSPEASPWAVLVSEVMLQQTPVDRVLPVWRQWLTDWPEPAALAAVEPAAAIRAWGRLGYPRRALRLHAAARAIQERHGGGVPGDEAALRALPGVGEYTAAAVLAFAFHRRAAVLDTNVRRVHARAFDGRSHPGAAVTSAERSRAVRLLPATGPAAAEFGVAVMELGALVCTARAPACSRCPLARDCRFRALGAPQPLQPRRRQAYAGTDRQARGALMALLRDADAPLQPADLAPAWDQREQRERALASLVTDGLAVAVGTGYALPGDQLPASGVSVVSPGAGMEALAAQRTSGSGTAGPGLTGSCE